MVKIIQENYEEDFNISMAGPDKYVIEQKVITSKGSQRSNENVSAKEYMNHYNNLKQGIESTQEQVKDLMDRFDKIAKAQEDQKEILIGSNISQADIESFKQKLRKEDLIKKAIQAQNEIENTEKSIKERTRDIEIQKTRLTEFEKFINNAKLHIKIEEKEQERKSK